MQAAIVLHGLLLNKNKIQLSSPLRTVREANAYLW